MKNIRSFLRNYFRLILTTYFQILFVNANAYFVANNMPMLIIPACFAISYLWTLNVKKIAFGGIWDRVIYATSASLGGVSGYYLSSYLSRLF
jgi:putative effector of murein hydrolase LrgA (UPF0299 family)